MTDQPTPRAPEPEKNCDWRFGRCGRCSACIEEVRQRRAAPEPCGCPDDFMLDCEVCAPTPEPTAPDDLAEWECPSCGATTRARMADRPMAPDDLMQQIAPRAPERATEVLRFVDEFLALGGNGEGWTGEHLRAVVAWGLGRELDDRGLMLARGVLGSDLIDSPPAPEPTAPDDKPWCIREDKACRWEPLSDPALERCAGCGAQRPVVYDEPTAPDDGPGDFWTQAEWAEWSNDLTLPMPQEYDDDVAQEAIIERFVTDAGRVYRADPARWWAVVDGTPEPTATAPDDQAPPCRQCGPGYRIGDEGCSHTADGNPLADAIKDVCWRAQPYGEDQDGFVQYYLLTSGSLHRLIGAAQGAGIPAAFRNSSQSTAPDDLQREIAQAVDVLVRAVHDTERESDVALATGPWLFDYEKVLRRNLTAAVMDVLRQNGLGRGRCAYPDGDRDCDPSLCPPECFEASR